MDLTMSSKNMTTLEELNNGSCTTIYKKKE